MIVYRCENEDKKGPFCTGGHFYEERFELLDRHNTLNSHPVPWKDGIDLRDADFCGFQSIELLKKWFSKKEREALRGFGWKFYALEVDKSRVKLGKHQCAFVHEFAVIKKEITEDEISLPEQNWLDQAGVEARSAHFSGQDHDLFRLADDGGIDLS